MTKTLDSLKNKILERIASDKISMKPRWHFALRLAVTIALLVAFGGLAFFLCSFLFFILPASGAWFLHDFGAPGWLHFFRLFPYLPAIILAASIILLGLVLERFSFAYHRPLVYLGLGTLLVVFAGSLLISKTPLHGSVYRQTRRAPLPVVDDFYRGYGKMRSNDVFLGTVNNVATSTFQIVTVNGEPLIINLDEKTRCPFDCDLDIDDVVMIMGRRFDGSINALGVRKIKSDEGFFGPPDWNRPPKKMIWP